MRATFKGETRDVGLNPTGYVADWITLQARDVKAIREMFDRSGSAPGSQFGAWLAQLEARFPENRGTGQETLLREDPSESKI